MSDDQLSASAATFPPGAGNARGEPFISRLALAIAWLFDEISVEFLDRLPNAVTVAAIVFLFSLAQGATMWGVVYWQLGQDPWLGISVMMLSSIAVASPIAGFGQMQYRRARLAYFNAQRLLEQLTIAKDEAQAANAEKSRFLTSMSHELRTPLNAIIGFSEIIKDEILGLIAVRRYTEYATDIHKSGQHLLSLINDILDISRIESGRGIASASIPMDLSFTAREACETMAVTADKNRVTLSVQLPNEPIWVSANQRMMTQILLNLLSNALKFTPENGNVFVRMEARAEGVLINVVDTGIGMTIQEQKIALQPFGQIDSFQARKHVGTGLGLPLVSAMVREHGSSLLIDSTPGEGTSVSFVIPRDRVIASGVPIHTANVRQN